MTEQPTEPQTAPDAATPVPVELVEETVETVTVRRAPKMLVFLLLGAAIGVLTALILTYAFGVVDPSGNEPSTVSQVTYTKSQVFGFLVLVCGTAGLALGGIVALILERTIGRHTRQVRVDRESVTTAE